ncbi:helix-turn-helix transcriptional regulator [Microbacterium sp. ARD32]|uniref:helix-turn-helix domain-containing protein n=1 Tax=Microbacterium sp. ARD32 TaxID=2962577 RepID=UPI002882C4A9|nr:helix-turn-helix transcriptional regulator [Microbacterium sp. ARD32]MDT0158643.1 helix-turn-helix transcriptional regulator [Microbacterium sp. ARD32]
MNASRSQASEKLGMLVRRLREKNSMSRQTLSERSGLNSSHLARIEAGEGNPTLFALIQLATALEQKPEVFVSGLTAADLPKDVKTPYSEADFRRELRRREGEA